MIREVVVIDEERCDGCGECVPACHEGAIQIIDAKARLISDRLCDGLGACLGHCPQDAIRIERREATPFDAQAVARRAHDHEAGRTAARDSTPDARRLDSAAPASSGSPPGCPSARFARLGPAAGCPVGGSDAPAPAPSGASSGLSHWPVQLRLLPPTAPMLRNAHLLLSADCVPVALADFHRGLLRGRAIAIACPKLDEMEGYLSKLTEMIRSNHLADITVAHMEVPCCTGLLMLALEARRRSGRNVPVVDVVVSTRGEIIARREVAPEVPARGP